MAARPSVPSDVRVYVSFDVQTSDEMCKVEKYKLARGASCRVTRRGCAARSVQILIEISLKRMRKEVPSRLLPRARGITVA